MSTSAKLGKTPRAGRMKPKDRAQQLLNTALSLFAEKGFTAKHTDIATRAQVSVPTTFVYFETREALVKAVIEEIKRFITTEILVEAEANAHKNPDSAMRVSAEALINAAKNNPDHVKVWLMWSVLFEPSLHASYREFELQILQFLLPIIEGKEIDFEQATALQKNKAHLILGSSLMLARMVLNGEDEAGLDDFVDLTIRSVITSLPESA